MRGFNASFVVAAVSVAGFSCLQPMMAATADSTASFSITSPTEVPGALLKAGAYTIQLVDHLDDRSIVHLDSVTGATHLIFLGVNATSGLNGTAHPVEWPENKKGHHALRGFVFPGGRSIEFVYPKADAVALANANDSGVVAIDPASEGRPELSKLTDSDMTVVNLWILTPVRVGPDNGQKGIEAKRYQAALTTTTPAPVVARSIPTISNSGQHGTVPMPTIARVETVARPQVAAHHAKPVVSQLPKTGSSLPLVWIAGTLSLAGAGLVRMRRISRA